jgi:hypothetical protein
VKKFLRILIAVLLVFNIELTKAQTPEQQEPVLKPVPMTGDRVPSRMRLLQSSAAYPQTS